MNYEHLAHVLSNPNLDDLQRKSYRESQKAAYDRRQFMDKKIRTLQAELRTEDLSYTKNYFVEKIVAEKEAQTKSQNLADQAKETLSKEELLKATMPLAEKRKRYAELQKKEQSKNKQKDKTKDQEIEFDIDDD